MNKANARWAIIARNRKAKEEYKEAVAMRENLMQMIIDNGLATPLDTFPNQPTEH